ncbi:MAG: tRNA (adenosine(37)-N6)-dimethylallyltransferase MiaA [Planctomycetes bacterium]|nr:tRNA (adenosine(37)-N6)-dimethylallyltransferase MiaA [Planctomycetota bacterium]
MSHNEQPQAPAALPPVLVVMAPTASGKSRLCMAVARRVGGEILSVDALKVYRGLEAGTAKPSAEERAEIPHHGLDLVDAGTDYSVALYLDYALPVLRDIVARGKVPILDATAPYYLKALVFGLDRGPEPRAEFRQVAEQRPLGDLYAELLAKDPESARRIGPGDRKRLVRALEIAEYSGRLASQFVRWGEPLPGLRWVFTGIEWPRDVLYARVRERALRMFEQGWLDEVQAVRAGGGVSRTAGLAHGYRRLQQHLDGELTLAEAQEQTVRDVKQFARKSMTFFRRFPRTQWLQVQSDAELDRAALYLAHEVAEMQAEFLRTPGP